MIASRPSAQLLDTRHPFETPEGIELELRIAGTVPRACAWAIDMGIRSVIYIALAILLTWAGGMGVGAMLIAFFLIEWFYPVIFEVYQGMTPGKRLLGLQVIHDDGTPVGWPSSILRNLLRAADFLPVLYGFGVVTMLANAQFKRLGDLAAGTLVVYREQRGARGQPVAAIPQPPPLDLAVSEQETLLDFSERAPRLTEQRREELADILSPITGLSGAPGVNRLHAYANWLSGARDLPEPPQQGR